MSTFDSYDQGTPSWIEHSSTDQQAAENFYSQLFGWQMQPGEMPDGQGSYDMAKLGDDHIAGFGPVMAPDQPASWGVYLAADDVDAAVERAQQAGGQVNAGPFDVGEAGRMAWVQDPSGAHVGLWQAADHIGTQRANEANTPVWNELVSADLEAAVPFYEQTLGMTRNDFDMGGETYTMLQSNGRDVAGSMAPMAEGVPNHWNVYFQVDDVDAAVARTQELGGGVLGEAMDVPGVGRMAFLTDPQGAAFNVMAPNPE